MSNAGIICSDDCIIIRANSRSLRENKVCEGITVTNCRLTTVCAGVRIGFVNDGIIRNCTLSNIVLTDSGAGVVLDFPDKELIQSDFGRESTEVENILFANIIMDRVRCPFVIGIGQSAETSVSFIRNLSFRGLQARCAKLPVIKGRAGTVIDNLQFSDCTFQCYGENPALIAEHVSGLVLNNTRISQE